MINRKGIKDLLEDFVEHASETLSLNTDIEVLKFMIDEFVDKKIHLPKIVNFSDIGFFVLYIKNKKSIMHIIAQLQTLLCNDLLLDAEFGIINNASEEIIFPLRLHLSEKRDENDEN